MAQLWEREVAELIRGTGAQVEAPVISTSVNIPEEYKGRARKFWEPVPLFAHLLLDALEAGDLVSKFEAGPTTPSRTVTFLDETTDDARLVDALPHAEDRMRLVASAIGRTQPKDFILRARIAADSNVIVPRGDSNLITIKEPNTERTRAILNTALQITGFLEERNVLDSMLTSQRLTLLHPQAPVVAVVIAPSLPGRPISRIDWAMDLWIKHQTPTTQG